MLLLKGAHHWRSQKPPPGARVEIDLAHPLACGLVSYWLMHEGAGARLLDLGPTPAIGSFVGAATPAWVTSARGPALSFDGTTAYIDIARATPNAVPLTLWTRFNATSTTGALSLLTIGGGTGAPAHEFGLVIVNGVLWALTQDAGGAAHADVAVSVSTGYSAAGVFTSATDRAVYLNGVVGGTDTTSKTPTAGSIARTRIGQRSNTGDDQKFAGLMSEAAVYGRALTAGEVLWLDKEPGAFLLVHPARTFFFLRPPDVAPALAESMTVGLAESLSVRATFPLSLAEPAPIGLAESIAITSGHAKTLAESVGVRLSESVTVEVTPAVLLLMWQELTRAALSVEGLDLAWQELGGLDDEASALTLTWLERQAYGGALTLAWHEVPDVLSLFSNDVQKPTTVATVA